MPMESQFSWVYPSGGFKTLNAALPETMRHAWPPRVKRFWEAINSKNIDEDFYFEPSSSHGIHDSMPFPLKTNFSLKTSYLPNQSLIPTTSKVA
jgi:hypothetical protein